MTLEELQTAKKPEILRLAAQHGARNARVFGSTVRGENDERSDVDFLVDLEPGRSLFDLGGLLMALQELLRRPVDVVTEKGLRPRIRDQVRATAVKL
jgi:predicted nucleotidyltransferase